MEINTILYCVLCIVYMILLSKTAEFQCVENYYMWSITECVFCVCVLCIWSCLSKCVLVYCVYDLMCQMQLLAVQICSIVIKLSLYCLSKCRYCVSKFCSIVCLNCVLLSLYSLPCVLLSLYCVLFSLYCLSNYLSICLKI